MTASGAAGATGQGTVRELVAEPRSRDHTTKPSNPTQCVRGDDAARFCTRRASTDPMGWLGESRTIDWAALSHAALPVGLRTRAIAVTVETDSAVYQRGEPVDIEVELRNRLPIPVRLRTDSPNVWTWAVDGDREASRVDEDVPDRASSIAFARGERKRFRRRWPQRIQVSETEWEAVDPGTSTIEVWISRADAAARGLADRTTIEVIPADRHAGLEGQ